MINIVQERINRWKNDLIDLSNRNRLLNFRQTKVTTIRVVDELPPEIFQSLVIDETAFGFLPSDKDEKNEELFNQETESQADDDVKKESQDFSNYDKNKLAERHKDDNLQTELSKEQLEKNLFRIHSKAASVMEEQGYNVLFLSLGCVEWYESDDSDKKLRAPVVLIPVELVRKGVKARFKIKYSSEQILFNPALLLKLANDFKINLEPLSEDIEEIDLRKTFAEIQKAIAECKRWRLTNDIYLGLFSFAKFVMYKDLETNLALATENDIVKTLCGVETEEIDTDVLCEPKELESHLKPSKTFQVLDADSSQQRAILAVKNGHSLVIEGPPGTGKSQTIANIIAECLSENKKVLFVSQKMAALEVVKKRLDNNGLGDYCLELHSKKTDKKAFIKELERVLNTKKKPDHHHDDDLDKLSHTRAMLNEYVKELSTPFGELGMTPFQAFGILSGRGDCEALNYTFPNADKWSKKKYVKCCDLLSNYTHNLSNVKDGKRHPWYGAKITELEYSDRQRLGEIFETVIDLYIEFETDKEKLANLTSFVKPTTFKDVESLFDAANLLLNSPKPPKSILQDSSWNSLGKDISDLIDTVKAFNQFKKDIANKYEISIIAEDIGHLSKQYSIYAKSGFFFLRPQYWRDRQLIKQYLSSDYKPGLKEVVKDLEILNKGKKEAAYIDNHVKEGGELFGNVWNGRDTQHDELQKFANWIIKFRSHVIEKHFEESIFDNTDKLDLQLLKAISDRVAVEVQKFKANLSELFQLTNFDTKQAFGCDINEASAGAIYKKIVSMNASLENIDAWLRYYDSLVECENEGLGEFIDKLLDSGVRYDKIVTIFKCSFIKSWLTHVFKERSQIRKFYGKDHEQLIEKFRLLDKRQIELAKVRLQHLLSGKVTISGETATSSEPGILLRETRKMRAHKSIRKLFKEIPRLITTLKPCLMMSPFTVSQFLDPKLISFDVVIFDEASQIPPEDAIVAIMRGNQIVVAGDSKQLPPTSFFLSEVITSEDGEDEQEEALPTDLDSILDECAVGRFPKTMLQWHYRSRHESLIAFSNINIYDGYLNTFPNAEDESPVLGVKFHHIPQAVYGRGSGGVNAEEAMEVARAVFRHFKEHPDVSLGVGTFSIRQKYAIEDSVEQLLKEDSSLESFFNSDNPEHFFVKNLETIQGDERDVIFISIGYGKDASGKLFMNFGPLNQNGGHRRLNVLVTRARNRVEIFSSIKGDDFDLRKTNSPGVHLLKKYLDFAEKGVIALAIATDESISQFSESPFEQAVYDALAAKGLQLRKQVGCSGYRIDMGVIDERKPGKYLLGVECDGACYHSSATARDRDRLRQSVLEDLGWTIHRIWSSDWFKNPKNEIDKVLERLERCKLGVKCDDEVSEKSDIPIRLKEPTKTQSPTPTKYIKTPIKRRMPIEEFYETSAEKIASVLKNVVEIEGPIHQDEAEKRVVEHWGIGAIKSRVREILDNAEAYCSRKKMLVKKGRFYWPTDMDKPTVRDREEAALPKDIEYVAPEEIAEGALLVLQNEFSMPKEDLISQVAKLFGIGRVFEDTEKYIKKSISPYIKDGLIKEVDGRLVKA